MPNVRVAILFCKIHCVTSSKVYLLQKLPKPATDVQSHQKMCVFMHNVHHESKAEMVQ